jgi:hypothetical protein
MSEEVESSESSGMYPALGVVGKQALMISLRLLNTPIFLKSITSASPPSVGATVGFWC